MDTWEVKAWPAWHGRLLAKDLSVPVSAVVSVSAARQGYSEKSTLTPVSDPGFALEMDVPTEIFVKHLAQPYG